MVDREIHIRFNLGTLLSRAWLMPVVVIGVFLLVWMLIYAPWGAESAPDWVQAIGGVAAICAAVWIASQDSRSRARERVSRDRVIAELVVRIADRSAGVSSLLFENFDRLIESDDGGKEVLTTVESQLLALRGINPVELPHLDMVGPFLKIRGALEQSHLMASLLYGSKGGSDVLRYCTIFSNNSQVIHMAAKELRKAASI